MTNTFTCNNCSAEKPITELAKKVEVFMDEPIKTCRECYDLYHNPPKKKLKEESFFCNFCQFEVTGVRYCKKVSVSMPNELGLINGNTYNFCSICSPKVKEYNEHEGRDWKKNPPKIWE